jgi:hypothetical protein
MMHMVEAPEKGNHDARSPRQLISRVGLANNSVHDGSDAKQTRRDTELDADVYL